MAYDYTEIFENGLSDQALMQNLNESERLFAPSSQVRFNGVKNLITQGYRTLVVEYGNGFNAVYWVSQKAWPGHRKKLWDLGFKEKVLHFKENSRRLG